MEERFIDPSTIRKNSIVKEKLKMISSIPIFSIVEFNITGSCNRSCSFCPVSNPEVYTKTKERMNISLFEKIVDDLQAINYSGKILFSAFSEPLLHKELESLIKIAKKKLPNCRIEIVSNGDYATEERLQSIFEAGLDTISISMYDGPHQIKHFNAIRNKLALNETQIILRRRYFENGNYGITISNRSGLINSNEFRDEHEQQITTLPLKEACYYPFYMIVIDYNGDVLLCPHDWTKKLSFGNLKIQNLWDIWKDKVLTTIRKKLSQKERDFFPCSQCDVLGTIIGKENFDAWNQISNG